MSGKTFGIEDLFKRYSKNILREEKIKYPLIEGEIMISFDSPSKIKDKELAKKISLESPKRFKTVVYYYDDPKLLPTSFQISYVYKVTFDINKIKKDYSKIKIVNKKDIDLDDEEIEKMILRKLNKDKDKDKDKDKNIKPKKHIVDMDSFYNDVFKKNFPSYKLYGKLNDLIYAGVLPIEDYNIFSITYSTQVDDKLLYRHLIKSVKQNKSNISVPFGYEIGFESNDKRRQKTESAILQFALNFSKVMNDTIFKDTEYYTISKKT